MLLCLGRDGGLCVFGQSGVYFSCALQSGAVFHFYFAFNCDKFTL